MVLMYKEQHFYSMEGLKKEFGVTNGQVVIKTTLNDILDYEKVDVEFQIIKVEELGIFRLVKSKTEYQSNKKRKKASEEKARMISAINRKIYEKMEPYHIPLESDEGFTLLLYGTTIINRKKDLTGMELLVENRKGTKKMYYFEKEDLILYYDKKMNEDMKKTVQLGAVECIRRMKKGKTYPGLPHYEKKVVYYFEGNYYTQEDADFKKTRNMNVFHADYDELVEGEFKKIKTWNRQKPTTLMNVIREVMSKIENKNSETMKKLESLEKKAAKKQLPITIGQTKIVSEKMLLNNVSILRDGDCAETENELVLLKGRYKTTALAEELMRRDSYVSEYSEVRLRKIKMKEPKEEQYVITLDQQNQKVRGKVVHEIDQRKIIKLERTIGQMKLNKEYLFGTYSRGIVETPPGYAESWNEDKRNLIKKEDAMDVIFLTKEEYEEQEEKSKKKNEYADIILNMIQLEGKNTDFNKLLRGLIVMKIEREGFEQVFEETVNYLKRERRKMNNFYIDIPMKKEIEKTLKKR